MSQPYQDLARREKKIAQAAADTAHAVGMSCLSASLATVSMTVVRAVLKNDFRGAVSEPAADLRSLRTSPALQQAKTRDLYQAETLVNKTLLDALRNGFEYDATERAKIIVKESTGLVIKVELTEKELADLKDFPIHGLRADEWARRMRNLLDNAIDQSLSQPLVGAFDVAVIPAKLSAVAKAHANSLSYMTKEAFFSGGKAAMCALRDALVA